MTNTNYDYSGYVGHNRPDDLAEITRLAEAQMKAEEQVAIKEEELKNAKEELRKISEDYLPEEMQTLGLQTYQTTSGLSVKLKEEIKAHISIENQPKAYNWLENNGAGAIIKSHVEAAFGRSEIEKANELVKQLTETGRPATLKRSVHSSTLGAYVREQLANGTDIPVDLFGVHRRMVAKVGIKE